eukprot:10772935-Ditylum_brightwellii.AAC.1
MENKAAIFSLGLTALFLLMVNVMAHLWGHLDVSLLVLGRGWSIAATQGGMSKGSLFVAAEGPA